MSDKGKSVDVQAEQTPEALVIRLSGDAGVDQVDDLDRELRGLAALKPKRAILDLSGVSVVASMAMGALLRFRNAVAADGGVVELAGLTKNVGESFRVAGLGRVLPMHASVAAALAAKPAATPPANR